jgi:hypothetical protein
MELIAAPGAGGEMAGQMGKKTEVTMAMVVSDK